MKWLVERRLSDVSARLRKSRDELTVLGAQLGQLSDEADDARLHSLVAETPLADREFRDSQRHADAFDSQRARLIARIAELEKTQDQLLEKLSGARHP